jgi:hypothetical protein
VLGEEFAEEIRAEMVRKGILVREIVNLEKTKRPVVNQDGTATWTVNGEFLKKHFQYKVVSERMVNISQDIYLVGTNVIQLRGYRDGDIFGVEIESRDFTMMLKLLLEVVWGMGEEATR